MDAREGSASAGLATGGLPGWAGRNITASTAPAAATPPATRQPMLSPCRNAFVAAFRTACPRAPDPAALLSAALTPAQARDLGLTITGDAEVLRRLQPPPAQGRISRG